MQFALQLFHTIFVYAELIFGFFALRLLARNQIARFHYKQFDDSAKQHEYDNQAFTDSDWIYDLQKTNNFNMRTLNATQKVNSS